MPGRSFKTAFCERFSCSSEEFSDAVFRKCLYRHAAPLVTALGQSHSQLFEEDRRAIEQFGMSTTLDEVRDVLEDFQYVNLTNKHWLRTGLNLRVSGRRLYTLAQRLAAEGLLQSRPPSSPRS
jgi:hypothetical protein